MSKTILMFDDTDVSLLPAGYDAYAAYADGAFANFEAVRARFPHAIVLAIDVLATNLVADVLDVEPGDASNSAAVPWVKGKINAKSKLIILYTSVSNVDALVQVLHNAGISRDQYKIWSAHYGAGAHICGPQTCGLASWTCDGTQFTDRALGSSLDETIAHDDMLGIVPPVVPADPTLRLGDTGDGVRKLQERLNVWGAQLAVDGSFGPLTLAAVQEFQAKHKLAIDGIVGPLTWAALNVAPPVVPIQVPYPPPCGLGEDFSRFPLRWDAVVVNGHEIRNYHLKVTDMLGTVTLDAAVTGTAVVLSRLHPQDHYKASVNALGGPPNPGVASIEIIA